MFLFFLIVILVGVLIYEKIFKPSRYWANLGIVHEPGWPLVGIMSCLVLRKKHLTDIMTDLYHKYSTERYFGVMQFTQRFLVLRDLDLIKQLGVKDFDSFHDHQDFVQASEEMLFSKSLVNLTGEEWKKMRATLSPAFTGRKMRHMFPLIAECAQNFAESFQEDLTPLEMKSVFTRVANDVIATTAFGIQVNSMKEPNNEFLTMGRTFTSLSPIQWVKVFIIHMLPEVAKILDIDLLPSKVALFFRTVINNNIDKREQENIYRPDLLHLLNESRKGNLKHEEHREEQETGFATVEESQILSETHQMVLTRDHIVAQALLFYFAGFETESTALCFLAHELAVNPEIQKRLQNEIDLVDQEEEGNISYQSLLGMKYLDQVVSEALRMWTPGFQIDRICNNNFSIPAVKPGEKDLIVEKGVGILIPVMALHRDPQYYPNPDRFDPERFNEDNRSKIIPGTYLPFGIGPRNCVGSRFALLEMKLILYHLLKKFDLVPDKRTVIPMKVSGKKINLVPDNGFNLSLKRRK